MIQGRGKLEDCKKVHDVFNDKLCFELLGNPRKNDRKSLEVGKCVEDFLHTSKWEGSKTCL